ncbi:MAG: M48 family metallopeptidase [Ruminococcus sp.]|nr:M48 family metallopeptidase [Ruminococcus sp.]
MTVCGYDLIRSKRKTIGISVKPDGKVVVRAPFKAPSSDIERFVQSNRDWIQRQQSKMLSISRQAAQENPFTEEEICEMAEKAAKIIPERVGYYAKLIGVTYGRITIRNQKTRWGSCSGKGDLNFNCLLVLAPPKVLDSVVVHELCHRKHMDHSAAFYAEVLRVFPDYYAHHDWLKKNGPVLIKRMTG